MSVNSSYTLIDVFIYDFELVCWYKEDDKNIFIKHEYKPKIYLETFNEEFCRKILKDQQLKKVNKNHLVKGSIDVLEVCFNSIKDFKLNFRKYEKILENVATFFNADISVEEMYLFENDLYPLKKGKDDINAYDYQIPKFNVAYIKIFDDGVELNKVLYDVKEFINKYDELDPDIIYIAGQQKELLGLTKKGLRLNRYGVDYFPQIQGNSYFSYGQAFYRETPIYLKGRLLINSSSFMVDDFNLYSVIEGARICRMRIQRLGSHSIGSAITNLLTHQAINDNYLIPYKTGVYEKIKPFSELINCDRGALTLEPYIGLHKNIAELDFVSMYPSIISHYNLSPETFNCNCCNEKIIGTNYNFCKKRKGIVPKVCDYLMDRRKFFKKRDDQISKYKVNFIKWLLVVIFGFQSFKAKKIGCIEVHESINAVARNTLLKTIKIAEKEGYEVIHGIVDSLYIKKEGINEKDCINLADKIFKKTNLPMEFKKIYNFITFLPSVNDPHMPVPTSYYGVGKDGKIKVRGIELRQRNAPNIVKSLQNEIIENLNNNSFEESFKISINILKNHINSLNHATADDLSMTIRIGKERYKSNCPQKILQNHLKSKGIKTIPGQSIKYIVKNFKRKEYIPKNEFKGFFDRKKYEKMLKKGLIRLFLPFNINMEKVDDELLGEKQKSLLEYTTEKIKNCA